MRAHPLILGVRAGLLALVPSAVALGFAPVFVPVFPRLPEVEAVATAFHSIALSALGSGGLLFQPAVAAPTAWGLFGEVPGVLEVLGTLVIMPGMHIAQKAR